MSFGVVHTRGLDPVLLWLWCRPAAVVPIQPLAWELPFASEHTFYHSTPLYRCISPSENCRWAWLWTKQCPWRCAVHNLNILRKQPWWNTFFTKEHEGSASVFMIIIFFLFGHAHGMRKFLGQGPNPHYLSGQGQVLNLLSHQGTLRLCFKTRFCSLFSTFEKSVRLVLSYLSFQILVPPYLPSPPTIMPSPSFVFQGTPCVYRHSAWPQMSQVPRAHLQTMLVASRKRRCWGQHGISNSPFYICLYRLCEEASLSLHSPSSVSLIKGQLAEFLLWLSGNEPD